jgi:hypothetical protein
MIDDVPVNLFGNAVDFHRLRLVDRVKQGRERIAQIEAATAAVANIEDAFKLLKKRGFLVKFFGLPGKWVPGRRLKTALASSARQAN